MENKKIISSIIVLFLTVAVIFSFFFFSYDKIVKEQITKILPFSEINSGITNGGKGNEINDVTSISGALTIKGIIEETNKQRINHNTSPLQEDFGLNEIARIKLNKMFEEQYFAHISPGGVGVSDIADSVGYEYLLIGDNLARGDYKDDLDVVIAWMDSPGHRKNILENRYEKIGIAVRKDYYKDREEWIAVQVFSMPASACPEIDKNLLDQINRRKDEIQRIEQKRIDIQYEIDNMQRGSKEHIAKVEEYNNLIITYNEIIRELDGMVKDYNNQIKVREECIRK